MRLFKVIISIIIGLIIVFLLSWGAGWLDILYTKTIRKEKQNAERETFEETQSYVEGKRQEALKLYKEWMQAPDEEAKDMIREVVSHSFANFNEDKLNGEVYHFVYSCKYK